jgi:hypothetical protein
MTLDASMRSLECNTGHIGYQRSDSAQGYPQSDEESGEDNSFILIPCSLMAAPPIGGDRFRDPDSFSKAGRRRDLFPKQDNILIGTPNGGEGITISSEVPAYHQKKTFPDRRHEHALGDGEPYLRSSRISIHSSIDNVLQLLPSWIPPLVDPPTISHLLYHLDSAWRPGLTKKQFRAIFNVCPCGIVAACREFDDARHYCYSTSVVMDVALLGEAEFLCLFHRLNASGLRKEIFAQIFASCSCGMVMTRRFHIHECKEE